MKATPPIHWTTPRHAALFRNDNDGLEVRHYPTAAEAVHVDREFSLPTPEQVEMVIGRRAGEMRHTAFARALGISPRTVRRQFVRGGLPGAKEHSERILMVPTHLLRVAKAWGLRQVERLAKAGILGGTAGGTS